MTIQDQPRRRNLATIVGSSLAVVAAGSLLAFSSLAERAGLDGLAAGGLQPMHPNRSSGQAHAITIPAPSTAPPGDPRDAIVALVRGTRTHRDADGAPAERVAFAPLPSVESGVGEPKPEAKPEAPKRPDRIDRQARVAVEGPDVAKVEKRDGPPYGNAWGYHEKGGDQAKPAQRDGSGKHAPKKQSDGGPVYARKASDDDASASKPPKVKKVEKVHKVKAPKG
ncbi:MAG TPA: hypothetical protein VEU29_01655, partial [Actinomycetota bacterium]|nr:hypothetical protein [Actinomycetota bacterium]